MKNDTPFSKKDSMTSHQTETDKNEEEEEEEEAKSFFLIINNEDFIYDRKVISERSKLINSMIQADPTADKLEIEIDNLNNNKQIVNDIINKKEIKICIENAKFIHDFTKILDIDDLFKESDDFLYNISMIKSSKLLKTLIYFEKLIFDLNEENILESVDELIIYIQEQIPNDEDMCDDDISQENSLKFLAFILLDACLLFPYNIDIFFSFINELDSKELKVMEKFAKSAVERLYKISTFFYHRIDAAPNSQDPECKNNSCVRELAFVLHRLLCLGYLTKDSIDQTRARLPYLLIYLYNQNWIDCLLQTSKSDIIFKEYDKLSKNNWELHKKLGFEANNEDRIFQIIKMDDVDSFQQLTNEPEFSYLKPLKGSFYERSSLLQGECNMINIVAFFGSVQIFKFIVLNYRSISPEVVKYAVIGGNIEIIHICEELKFDFSDAIYTALFYHRNDILVWLLQTKEIPILENKKIALKCIRSNNYFAMKFLMKYGYNVSNFLGEIVFHSEPEIFKLFVNMHGIDPNSSFYGNTYLHNAIVRDNPSFVHSLLSLPNIDVNRKNKGKNRPIIFSCIIGNYDIFKMLIDRKEINLQCSNKKEEERKTMAVIHYACKNTNPDVMKLLVTHDEIEVNVKNYEEIFMYFYMTALHLACKNPEKSVLVEVLLTVPFIKVNPRSVFSCIQKVFLFFNGVSSLD